MKYDFTTHYDRNGTGSSKWITMHDAKPDVAADIMPFSIADMEFLAPPQVEERISAYLKTNILGYTRKTDEYLTAVQNWFGERHGWKIEKDWILDYPGIVPALVQLIASFSAPGDGIILMSPVYYPFFDAIRNAEGRELIENFLKYENNAYTIDFEDLEKKAKQPNARILILCNPHNPVGRVWSKEELNEIGRICLENNVLIISDDIHCDLVMDGYEHTFLASLSPEYAENTITCTAPSKTFNMAGLLTSNLIIPNLQMRKKFLKDKKASAVNYCNVLGYQATIACYAGAGDWVDELMTVLNRNKQILKDFMARELPEIGVIELEGTYLQWLDCRSVGLTGKELEQLMHDYSLFFDEGYVFGECGECFERMNIACPTDVLEAALMRFRDAVRSVKK